MGKIWGLQTQLNVSKNPHSLGLAVPPVFRIALSSVWTLDGVEWILDFELEAVDSNACLWNLHYQLSNLKKKLPSSFLSSQIFKIAIVIFVNMKNIEYKSFVKL